MRGYAGACLFGVAPFYEPVARPGESMAGLGEPVARPGESMAGCRQIHSPGGGHGAMGFGPPWHRHDPDERPGTHFGAAASGSAGCRSDRGERGVAPAARASERPISGGAPGGSDPRALWNPNDHRRGAAIRCDLHPRRHFRVHNAHRLGRPRARGALRLARLLHPGFVSEPGDRLQERYGSGRLGARLPQPDVPGAPGVDIPFGHPRHPSGLGRAVALRVDQLGRAGLLLPPGAQLLPFPVHRRPCPHLLSNAQTSL